MSNKNLELLNIVGSEDIETKGKDTSYRYKMPPIAGKFEGSGNGSKTALLNIVKLACALHCEPDILVKFFGIEIGTQSSWNSNTERAIVNGFHTQQYLQKLTYEFINHFVLCPKCGLPETILKVKGSKKNSSVYHKCNACGTRTIINHKLCNYIIAQSHKENKEKKGKKGKKKKEKKIGKKEKEEEEKKTQSCDDSEEDWGDADFSPEAIASRAKELGVSKP